MIKTKKNTLTNISLEIYAAVMAVIAFFSTLFAAALAPKRVLCNKRGDGYIESAIWLVVAVVLGALLLGGLYVLFDDVIMDTLTEKVTNLFNFTA